MNRPVSARWHQPGPVTVGLIALNVVVFSALTVQPDLVNALGLASGWDAVAQRPWTVVTVMFTSGHLLHAAAAVGVILFLGGALERRVGSLHLLGIYVLSGVTGSVAIVTTASAGASTVEVSVGASAAFLGLLGAIASGPPTPLVKRLQPSRLVVVVLVVNLALPVSGLGDWVSSVAHVSGIVAGAMYGHVLRTRSSTETEAETQHRIPQPSRRGGGSTGRD